MQKRTKLITAGVAAVVIGSGAALGLTAVGSDDDATETPITGAAYDRAAKAALDVTGEGRVTDTEVGDEEGYYEVEVTLDDGSQVDVHLDQGFNHLGTEDDGAGDGEGDDD